MILMETIFLYYKVFSEINAPKVLARNHMIKCMIEVLYLHPMERPDFEHVKISIEQSKKLNYRVISQLCMFDYFILYYLSYMGLRSPTLSHMYLYMEKNICRHIEHTGK